MPGFSRLHQSHEASLFAPRDELMWCISSFFNDRRADCWYARLIWDKACFPGDSLQNNKLHQLEWLWPNHVASYASVSPAMTWWLWWRPNTSCLLSPSKKKKKKKLTFYIHLLFGLFMWPLKSPPCPCKLTSPHHPESAVSSPTSQLQALLSDMQLPCLVFMLNFSH